MNITTRKIPRTPRTPRTPLTAVAVVVTGLTVTSAIGAGRAWAAGEMLTPAQGAGQSTNVGTTFATALGVTVSGPAGDSGTVTFTAPGAGPGAIFAGSRATDAGLEDVVSFTLPSGSGTTAETVTADPLTANSVSGSYQVSATVAGGGGPASFSLANNGLSASGGSQQTTRLESAFPSPLTASVFANGAPVVGATVTFTAPNSGASAVFAGTNTNTVTVTTDAHGQASAALAANDTAGSYGVSASSSAGVVGSPTWSLTNSAAGIASSVSVWSGSNQSAAVDSQFSAPLVAEVTDANGHPIQGIPVAFSISAHNGAGAQFATGAGNATETTNSSGLATSPALTANSTAGPYGATASVDGVTTPASYALTNSAGGVETVEAGLGAEQATPTGQAFPVPLSVTVTDSDGNPVPGLTVTFQAPSTGPSGTFAGSRSSAAVTTSAKGIAVAPAFTANSSPGGYTVTASVAGGPEASFALVNQAGATSGPTTATPSVVGIAATPDGEGYWLVAADGGVFSFGDADFYGSAGAARLAAPIVGMASTPDGHGYWLVAADGGVFSYGDAAFYGSAGATRLVKPIVGIASMPDGHGYWLVAADGGVFTYGNAGFYGSAGATRLVKPIVGIASTPDGHGYWLVAADGGVFTYGDAGFYGSAGAARLAAPIVGIASTPDGHGYWLVAADGGIFTYGDAPFLGSAAGQSAGGRTTALAPSGFGPYRVADADGTVSSFGGP